MVWETVMRQRIVAMLFKVVLSGCLTVSVASSQEVRGKVLPAPKQAVNPFAGMGDWTARSFFDDDWACSVCEAIAERDQARIQRLVNAGFDVNQAGRCGVTVLYWALFYENFEAFQWLLDQGADPDRKLTGSVPVSLPHRPISEDSVLSISVQNGRMQFFDAAIRKSKDVNQRSAYGASLLSNYVNGGSTPSPRMMRYLIQRGADIDAVDSDSLTPACLAMMYGRPDLSSFFLRWGADPDIPSVKGATVSSLLNSWAFRKIDYDSYWYPAMELRRWLDEN